MDATLNWIPVTSSQISEIGYDATTLTMGIRFLPSKRQRDLGEPGAEYRYFCIPVELWGEMAKAESKGEFLGSRIKPFPDKFPYVKMGPAAELEAQQGV